MLEKSCAQCETAIYQAWEKFSRDQFEAGYCAAMTDSREALAEIVNDKDAVVWFERFYENPDDPDEKTILIELNRAIAAVDGLGEKNS